MHVIHVHNAHEGLYEGLNYLNQNGIWQNSRNGSVVRAVGPVATVYSDPLERVVSWPDRDANPFFHLYESLWMLSGRNDVAGPARYAKQMLQYSDDGKTLHDAYGFRWRTFFGKDQLRWVILELQSNPLSRQAVLQMWDPREDLGRRGKAIPCNLTVTFQIDPRWNKLNMVVFCRSNDIIWGTYGANAVHFGFLLEYMALKIGVKAGTYTQISVNYHAYKEQFFKCTPILHETPKPYTQRVIPMSENVDTFIPQILEYADAETDYISTEPWSGMCHAMMWAHHEYRKGDIGRALRALDYGPECDWTTAGKEWLLRRKAKRELSVRSASSPAHGVPSND